MPIYEYECVKCGEKFEEFRTFRDKENAAKCPKCGAEDTQRVFSSFCTGTYSSGGDACYSGPT